MSIAGRLREDARRGGGAKNCHCCSSDFAVVADMSVVVACSPLTAAKAAQATPTKMELATEIYKQMRTVKNVTRKDIIEKFIAIAKLTKARASTYY